MQWCKSLFKEGQLVTGLWAPKVHCMWGRKLAHLLPAHRRAAVAPITKQKLMLVMIEMYQYQNHHALDRVSTF